MKAIVVAVFLSSSTWTWAAVKYPSGPMSCKGLTFRDNVRVNEQGQLYQQKGESGPIKILTPEKTDPLSRSYHFGAMGCEAHYTVRLDENKKLKQVEVHAPACPVDHFGFGKIQYDFKISDGNCRVTKVTENIEKKIYFDSGLCEKLSDEMKGLTAEINQCTDIFKKMTSTIQQYKDNLKGYKLETSGPAGNPFEASLLFAADCRKLLGIPSEPNERSLRLQPAVGATQ